MIAAGADRSHRGVLPLPAWLLAVIGTLILAFAAPVATAQTPSAPASLIAVKIYDGAPGETRVLLTFNRILPQFSIVTNDNDHPSLGFGDTVRGSGAVVPPGAHGLLRSIEFSQRDSVLVIALVGSSALHLSTTTLEGRAVSVSITAASSAPRDTGGGATGNLPQFTDRNPSEDTFAVVPLKYADISEVVGLLSAGPPIKPNDNFTPQEPAFGSSGFSNGSGAGANNFVSPVYNPNGQDAAATTYGQLVDDSIGVDRRLNAIILRGPPERVARLKEKIAQLDIPVQSVLLETVFVELTETGASNVGLDFNNAAGQIGVATYQYNRGGVSGSGGFVSDTTQRWGAVSTNLQAAIYDQVKKGEGRIISRPRISAQSGSPAKIITGDALPILTSIALSGVNAVSQQVQYVNVGVTLQIAPRISADGYVTSHIFAEVSSVTGFSQGYPTISQREASTSATVKDGEYFVIGGLTQENSLNTRIRVGGLGDIPILGEFFRHNDKTSSKTVLYIIVTPHIVRGDESAAARAETER